MSKIQYAVCWICGHELYGDLKSREVHIETCYLASLKKRKIKPPVFAPIVKEEAEQPLLPFPPETDYSVPFLYGAKAVKKISRRML